MANTDGIYSEQSNQYNKYEIKNGFNGVRITHMPTGITVSCYEHTSRFANHQAAMKILRAKLYEMQNPSYATLNIINNVIHNNTLERFGYDKTQSA